MKKWLTLLLTYSLSVYALNINPETTNALGDRIWKNECAGTIDGLTHWSKGENFPSLGIGHFLWYPTGTKERFDEGFPQLLTFLQEQGVVLPAWIKDAKGAPWTSRDHFYRHFQSAQMVELRTLLLETKNLQALFITKRLEKALPLMQAKVSLEEASRISALFNELASTPEGLYALVDYANFKGIGVLETEAYQGQGWGLLQVLQGMQTGSVQNFVESAKKALSQRVALSPPERNEQKWLKGWFNRLDSYLNGI